MEMNGGPTLADYLKSAFPGQTRVMAVGDCGISQAEWAASGMTSESIQLRDLTDGCGVQHPAVAEVRPAGYSARAPGVARAVVWRASPSDVESGNLFSAAFALRSAMEPGARLLVQWPTTNAEAARTPGPSEWTLLLERLGVRLQTRWQGAEDRAAPTFLLYEQACVAGSRAIDRIEAVLSADRKVATYKLALIRALAEIALAEYRTVQWLDDDHVGVPLGRIAERWLYYYWPIFDNAQFIPQIQGESPVSGTSVSFRHELTTLAVAFRLQGGMSGFYRAHADGALGNHANHVEKLIRKIGSTILVGPVRHSGGMSSPIFHKQTIGRMHYVVVPRDIWTELTLLGHWIVDAVKLRWAEKTHAMAGRSVGISEVLDLLLEVPQVPRDTAEVRRLFSPQDEQLVCVWSGNRILRNRLAIDHVLPYSIWGNNDLWNLLPADAKVNAGKSDKLPSRRQMQASKGRMQYYWRMTRDAKEHRFDQEMQRVTGIPRPSANWADELYEFVYEAVELTATQTGASRWEGL